jgi:hypothetical protein
MQGHLERAEDPAPQLQRVVDRLHPRRVCNEFVVAEVRLTCASASGRSRVRR